MRKCVSIFLMLMIFSSGSLALERFVKMDWLESDSFVASLIQYPELVDQIYAENDFQLIWFDTKHNSYLESQLEIIEHAGFSSLFSRQLAHMRKLRENSQWFEYDLLATDTMLLYMSYAERAASSDQGKEWFFQHSLSGKLPTPSRDAVLSFFVAIEVHQLDQLVNAYTPSSQGYKQLVSSFWYLKQYEQIELPLYRISKLVKSGDTLDNRDLLIQRLQLANLDASTVRTDVSWYDDTLVKLVKEFQSLHGLKPDGVIGPATLSWLNLPLNDRLAMLALNAERSRMWPEQRDTIIMVNVPSFDMKYWYLGEEVFESKVVVGRTTRKTPVMTTKLDSLILNPTWNVPRKIMVEDILPQVVQDASYLERQNFEIIKSWYSKPDNTVNPELIDWSAINPNTFPYKMRQQSGQGNALGLYKFNTPNPRAIFLHDTPSKHLFGKETRAFSSGCVRVENADQFASLLLETQGIDAMEHQSEEMSSNHAIPLKRRIPVHIIYQTVWYEAGKVHYRDDVYRYDTFSYTKG
ncbi:L,D-transpeptidase family protein [Vibrio mexicanus]|uniref:L,D-transpeptidase family protein n=1 Tax=Vibrio mexicanus TaxID=1004326 RepID=UPI00063C236C|nr:L,D-transpeptidase family protein [Vibrio mexicanus]